MIENLFDHRSLAFSFLERGDFGATWNGPTGRIVNWIRAKVVVSLDEQDLESGLPTPTSNVVLVDIARAKPFVDLFNWGVGWDCVDERIILPFHQMVSVHSVMTVVAAEIIVQHDEPAEAARSGRHGTLIGSRVALFCKC